ncbi:uncharacterized protein LOC120137752 [Hibiscus syriacus]|uniref:uncharacterized protein LOC120137752 n=1 Tax=Hibiscus syriacus TaxID=106335 RepID=UPI00192367D5|nr:uncharacterized protein LOC120137752 [Hibiscus syriacus]
MEEFQGCIEDLEVQDHPFVGPLFTWSNKQEGSYLARKLDMIMINAQWLLELSDSFAEYKAPGVMFSKLKRLKPILKDLNNQHYSDISARVIAKRAELEHVQIFNLARANQIRIEEKRRIQSYLEGDLNTKFFNQKVESHKKMNTIRVIKNEAGHYLETFEGMVAVLLEFYSKLIGAADPLVQGCQIEGLRDLLNYSLPAGADRVLVGEILDMEIKEALFRQGKDKSPGPDGYTSSFFKTVWGIVSKDFLSAVRILVTRLAQYFPDMISASLSAFVKGISITDNTLLAQEIVKGYSRKNISPRCVIKIDLQKAFDSINWGFMLNVLGAMSLPAIFYAAARNGIFKYHPRCKRNSLAHICFVDDLLLFCYGSMDSVLGVVSVQDKFYELSRLRLNASKTEINACGLNGGDLEEIQCATDFRIAQLPVRYLGVPLVTRKLSEKVCIALLVRIKEKLRQWSSRKLSFGGRLQLIKTVMFNIFSYWSKQLVLPKGVIQDIEKLCMCFFWKGNDTLAREARVSWNQICSPRSEGGLGLMMADWNKTCYFLLVKNILADEGSLWIAWIKAYCFKHEDYWSVGNKSHFSWILRKLIKLREEVGVLFPAPVSWTQVRGRWVWDRIRERKEKVEWYCLVWFPAHIPKFSLITWMTILDRLPTKDILARFGVVTDLGCGLCEIGLESKNHLFLEGPYLRAVWDYVLHDCRLQQQGLSWDDLLCWMASNWKVTIHSLAKEIRSPFRFLLLAPPPPLAAPTSSISVAIAPTCQFPSES